MDMVAKLEGTADERGHPGPGLSGKARVGGSNPTPEVWGGGVDSTTHRVSGSLAPYSPRSPKGAPRGIMRGRLFHATERVGCASGGKTALRAAGEIIRAQTLFFDLPYVNRRPTGFY